LYGVDEPGNISPSSFLRATAVPAGTARVRITLAMAILSVCLSVWGRVTTGTESSTGQIETQGFHRIMIAWSL